MHRAPDLKPAKRRLPVRSLLAAHLLLAAANAGALVPGQIDITTRAYDNDRSGWNANETTFTPTSLGTLHVVRTYNVDEKVEAQPLTWGNALYIFTMNNSIYRFDTTNGALLSSRNLAAAVDPCVQPGQMDMWCVYHKWGIAGTPVLDTATNRLYVVTFQTAGGNNANREHHLWTLDATTLATVSDHLIQGNSDNGAAHFNTGTQTPYQKLRAGLGLLNNAGHKAVIVAFSMNGENPAGPGHGFVFAYDTIGLEAGGNATPAIWCSTPTTGAGGIWMAGSAPAISGDSIFLTTGNGGIAANNYGESFVKLSYTAAGGGKPSLTLADYWTAFNDATRADPDQDLGASGVMLITGLPNLIGGGKDGVLYNLNVGNLGHNSWLPHLNLPFVATYAPAAPNNGTGLPTNTAVNAQWPISNLDRNLPANTPDKKTHHIHGNPVFLAMPGHGNVYVWGENERVKVYNLNYTNNMIDAFRNQGTVYASAGKAAPGGMPGGMMSLSSYGSVGGTALLWTTIPKNGDANTAVVQGSFVVYDATTIINTNQLKQLKSFDYNYFSKFCPPVVTGGKAFVSTFNTATGAGSVVQYGL
jgi:hypothetical protein